MCKKIIANSQNILLYVHHKHSNFKMRLINTNCKKVQVVQIKLYVLFVQKKLLIYKKQFINNESDFDLILKKIGLYWILTNEPINNCLMMLMYLVFVLEMVEYLLEHYQDLPKLL